MVRIVEARTAKGWSQKQLADAIGTSQQQIARFEAQGSDIKSSVLVKLSDALGVSVSWLLGLTDDSKMATNPASQFLNFDEKNLISLFRSCTPDNRKTLIKVAESLSALSQTSEKDSESYSEAI